MIIVRKVYETLRGGIPGLPRARSVSIELFDGATGWRHVPDGALLFREDQNERDEVSLAVSRILKALGREGEPFEYDVG